MNSSLNGRINSLVGRVEQLSARWSAARDAVQAARYAADAADDDYYDAQHAHAIVIDLATYVQQTAHAQIADVVSRCLAAVFNDPYTFAIDFVRRRSTTEAVVSLVRNGQPVPPLRATGGGVVDVVAFALRVAAVALQPGVRRCLILDEPFKFVSADYLPACADLLVSLAKDMDFQFIMVTHIDALAACVDHPDIDGVLVRV